MLTTVSSCPPHMYLDWTHNCALTVCTSQVLWGGQLDTVVSMFSLSHTVTKVNPTQSLLLLDSCDYSYNPSPFSSLPAHTTRSSPRPPPSSPPPSPPPSPRHQSTTSLNDPGETKQFDYDKTHFQVNGNLHFSPCFSHIM